MVFASADEGRGSVVSKTRFCHVGVAVGAAWRHIVPLAWRVDASSWLVGERVSRRIATVGLWGVAVVAALGGVVVPKASEPLRWFPIVVSAAAAVAALVFGVVSDRIKKFSASRTDRAIDLDRARSGGALVERRFSDVDPVADLGVHPALRVSQQPSLPPYVPRTVDAQLDELLDKGGFVVVEGDSAAGKSRSAYEALIRLTERDGRVKRIVIPKDGAALRGAIEAGFTVRDKILWLDDLERFIVPEGLDDALFRALRANAEDRLLVVATLRANARDALGMAPEDSVTMSNFVYGARKLLACATCVRMERQLDQAERKAADERKDDQRIGAALLGAPRGIGLAEYLSAGPAAVERLHAGRNGANRQGAALILAAIDLRRAGYLDPVPAWWLTALAPTYLTEPVRESVTAADRKDGLAWATQSVQGASPCLRQVSDDRYRVFDYLVDQAESRADSAVDTWSSLRTVPGDIWHFLLRELRIEDPQFLSCLAAGEAAGHPGLATRFADAIASGAVDPAFFADGGRMLSLVITCLRIRMCVFCMIKILNLDTDMLMREIGDRLTPHFHATTAAFTAFEEYALVAADYFGREWDDQPKLTVLAPGKDVAYAVGMLLLREGRTKSARSWLEVAAADDHASAKKELTGLVE